MKISKQDIQDLLSQLAADIEEIKTMLNGEGAGRGVTVKSCATSNDVAVGNQPFVLPRPITPQQAIIR